MARISKRRQRSTSSRVVQAACGGRRLPHTPHLLKSSDRAWSAAAVLLGLLPSPAAAGLRCAPGIDVARQGGADGVRVPRPTAVSDPPVNPGSGPTSELCAGGGRGLSCARASRAVASSSRRPAAAAEQAQLRPRAGVGIESAGKGPRPSVGAGQASLSASAR